ncbi:MAG: 3-oxoacyl-[acyl-carrier-protein] reductase [Streptococcaceae bacterium]|jgi:3-oxoacyl-[acyl-carrier protein] reductase|nr:3-oxoacyl-[acyl-carrier-protein] reductase [Streptococcaceae bacterium]
MEIQNKNVFVTGSTRGIGAAIALAFVKAGANVVINGRSAEAPASFSALQVIARKSKVAYVGGDISSNADAKRMVADATEVLGAPIDVLVNNAGITRDGMALRMSDDDFNAVLQTNLTGAFNMIQSVLKPMTKAREGAIINIASVSGLIGNPGQANYSAAKAGLIGLTKSIAHEYASRNIRVNAVAPGFIETDMTADLSEKIKETVNGQIPLGRFGKPDEVASVVLFLAQQEYLTGQTIAIDGGLTMY